MSIGYAYACDGPDCDVHTQPVATAPPYLPYGFIGLRWNEAGQEMPMRVFCSWACVMKYAAGQPIPERIEESDGGH